MLIALGPKIRNTQAALEKERNPKRRAALQADGVRLHMSDEAWLEEWAFVSEERAGGSAELHYGMSSVCVAPFMFDAHARLAAAAPALVRALLRVEWGSHAFCPACGGASPGVYGYDGTAGHTARDAAGTCPIDAALTAAGFPDQASRDVAREKMGKR